MGIQTIFIVPARDPGQIVLVNGPITITFSAGHVTVVVGDNFVTDVAVLSQIGLTLMRSAAVLLAEGALRDEIVKLIERMAHI